MLPDSILWPGFRFGFGRRLGRRRAGAASPQSKAERIIGFRRRGCVAGPLFLLYDLVVGADFFGIGQWHEGKHHDSQAARAFGKLVESSLHEKGIGEGGQGLLFAQAAIAIPVEAGNGLGA